MFRKIYLVLTILANYLEIGLVSIKILFTNQRIKYKNRKIAKQNEKIVKLLRNLERIKKKKDLLTFRS